jgi:hypothetical protein
MDKPKNITAQEWADYQLKLKNGKPLTDKEWELFQSELVEAGSSQKTIGVNLFSKTISFEKKDDSTTSISSDLGNYFHISKYKYYNHSDHPNFNLGSINSTKFKCTSRSPKGKITRMMRNIFLRKNRR